MGRRLGCCCQGCDVDYWYLGVDRIEPTLMRWFRRTNTVTNGTEQEWRQDFDSDDNPTSGEYEFGSPTTLTETDVDVDTTGDGLVRFGTRTYSEDRTVTSVRTQTATGGGNYYESWTVQDLTDDITITDYTLAQFDNALELFDVVEGDEVGEDTYLTGSIQKRASIGIKREQGTSYGGATIWGKFVDTSAPTDYAGADTTYGSKTESITFTGSGYTSARYDTDTLPLLPTDTSDGTTFELMLGPDDGVAQFGTPPGETNTQVESTLLTVAFSVHRNIGYRLVEQMTETANATRVRSNGFTWGSDPDLQETSETTGTYTDAEFSWSMQTLGIRFGSSDTMKLELLEADDTPVWSATVSVMLNARTEENLFGQDVHINTVSFSDGTTTLTRDGSSSLAPNTYEEITPSFDVYITEDVIEVSHATGRGEWSPDGGRNRYAKLIYHSADIPNSKLRITLNGRKVVTGFARYIQRDNPYRGRENECGVVCDPGPHGQPLAKLISASTSVSGVTIEHDPDYEFYSSCGTTGFRDGLFGQALFGAGSSGIIRDDMPTLTSGWSVLNSWTNFRVYETAEGYSQEDGILNLYSNPSGYIPEGIRVAGNSGATGSPGGVWSHPDYTHDGNFYAYGEVPRTPSDVQFQPGPFLGITTGSFMCNWDLTRIGLEFICGEFDVAVYASIARRGFLSLDHDATEGVTERRYNVPDTGYSNKAYVESYSLSYADAGDTVDDEGNAIPFLEKRCEVTLSVTLASGYITYGIESVSGTERTEIDNGSPFFGPINWDNSEPFSGQSWFAEAAPEPQPGHYLPESFPDPFNFVQVAMPTVHLDKIWEVDSYYIENIDQDGNEPPGCEIHTLNPPDSVDFNTNSYPSESAATTYSWEPFYYYDVILPEPQHRVPGQFDPVANANIKTGYGGCGGPAPAGASPTAPWNETYTVKSDDIRVSHSGSRPSTDSENPSKAGHSQRQWFVAYKKLVPYSQLLSPNVATITFGVDDLWSQDDSDGSYFLVAKNYSAGEKTETISYTQPLEGVNDCAGEYEDMFCDKVQKWIHGFNGDAIGSLPEWMDNYPEGVPGYIEGQPLRPPGTATDGSEDFAHRPLRKTSSLDEIGNPERTDHVIHYRTLTFTIGAV